MTGGSDADADDNGDEDELEAMGATKLDSDSEEASDTEWRAWMTFDSLFDKHKMTNGNENSNKTLEKKKKKTGKMSLASGLTVLKRPFCVAFVTMTSSTRLSTRSSFIFLAIRTANRELH